MTNTYLMNWYARLQGRYWRLLGKAYAVAEQFLPSRSRIEDVGAGRKVIIHFHNFKSAGTSIDYILQRNFGGRWMAWEENDDPAAITALIQKRPSLKAISSHTVAIRLPESPGIQFFPIVFLRHPIDRAVSMYRFYNQYRRHPGQEAEQARQTDLPGFIAWQLERGRDYRNYYTMRLSQWNTGPEASEQGEFERARRALLELPFVGLVDQFDASLSRLADYLGPDFPGFQIYSVQANVTAKTEVPLDQRLGKLRKDIGDTVYEQLNAANRDDIELYEIIRASYLK